MTVVLKEQNRVAEHIESNLCSSLANLGHIYLRSRDEGSTSRCPKTNRSVQNLRRQSFTYVGSMLTNQRSQQIVEIFRI